MENCSQSMPRNSHSILSLVKWSATFDSPGTLAIFNRPIAIFTTSCTQRNLNSTGAHWRNRLHLSCKAYPSSITRATHIDPLVPHANGAVLVGMHQCLNWPEDRSWRDCCDVLPSTSWRMQACPTHCCSEAMVQWRLVATMDLGNATSQLSMQA